MADVAGRRLRLCPVAFLGTFPLVGPVVKIDCHVDAGPVVLRLISAVPLQDVFGPGFFCQEVPGVNLSAMNACQKAANADGERFEQRGLPFPVFADDQVKALPEGELTMFNSFEIMDDDFLDVHGFTPLQALIRAFAEDDGFDGLEQVHEVDPDGPVADVPGVHGDAFFVGGVAAAAGLPHAGDAGQDHAVLAEVFAVALDLGRDDGPRAYEAHVAADDVPELRELVEAGLAQEGAELRDARVVLELEVGFPFLTGLGVLGEVFLEGLLSVRDHGLELVAREEPAVLADALVREDDVAFVVDGDDEDEAHQDWRDDDAAADGADEVEHALDGAVAAAREVVFHREHENLFAEEGLRLDAGHRGADEVGHEGDALHVGLNLLDEVLQGFFLEARGRDDDVLDARVAHDALRVFHFTIKQEFL